MQICLRLCVFKTILHIRKQSALRSCTFIYINIVDILNPCLICKVKVICSLWETLINQELPKSSSKIQKHTSNLYSMLIYPQAHSDNNKTQKKLANQKKKQTEKNPKTNNKSSMFTSYNKDQVEETLGTKFIK